MPNWGGAPDFGFCAYEGWQMVLQWLNSPVMWAVIVLIMSGIGILRELFF